MLVLAFFAAVAAEPVKLGPFVSNEPFSQASAAAAATDLRLQFWQHYQGMDEYFIFQGQSNLRGVLATCGGKVQFVSFNVDTYDDFTSVLRQRIAEWGSPRTEAKTIQLLDASRSFDELVFSWPLHRFSVTFHAHQVDGLKGDQNFGEGLTCYG